MVGPGNVQGEVCVNTTAALANTMEPALLKQLLTPINGVVKGPSTGMAIIEVDMFTGFSLADLDATRTANAASAKRVEYKTEAATPGVNERDKVVFYVDALSSTPTCVTFHATRDTKAGRLAAVAIRAYDYYYEGTAHEVLVEPLLGIASDFEAAVKTLKLQDVVTEAVPTEFCINYNATCSDPKHSVPYGDCVKEFKAMDKGVAGATSGDTQACREYHLSIAMSSTNPEIADLHCPHASSFGGGVCVVPPKTTQPATTTPPPPPQTTTQAPVVTTITTTTTTPQGPVEPSAFCRSFARACAGFAAPYSNCFRKFSAMAKGNVSDATGDTQECRAYHLAAALTPVAVGANATDAGANKQLHCPHASLFGGGVCVRPGRTTIKFFSPTNATQPVTAAAAEDKGSDNHQIIITFVVVFVIVGIMALASLVFRATRDGDEADSQQQQPKAVAVFSNPAYEAGAPQGQLVAAAATRSTEQSFGTPTSSSPATVGADDGYLSVSAEDKVPAGTLTRSRVTAQSTSDVDALLAASGSSLQRSASLRDAGTVDGDAAAEDVADATGAPPAAGVAETRASEVFDGFGDDGNDGNGNGNDTAAATAGNTADPAAAAAAAAAAEVEAEIQAAGVDATADDGAPPSPPIASEEQSLLPPAEVAAPAPADEVFDGFADGDAQEVGQSF